VSANKGDEVFFHHKGEPKSGRVLCTGKHGCHVEDGEGARHKLKWGHIAGHKKRAPQTYKVQEEGEDGLIVADDAGRRRLVRIPPEARAEQLQLEPQAITQGKRARNAPGA
jgi:hypothetical protein